MRVGIVHNYQLYGSGSCVYTRELARYLKELGCDVFLFSREKKPQDFAFIDEAWFISSKLRELAFKKEIISKRRCVSFSYAHIPYYAAYSRIETEAKVYENMSSDEVYKFTQLMREFIKQMIKEHKIDILIVNHAIFLPYICSSLNIPYVVVVHGTALAVVEKNSRFSYYLRIGLEKAKRVIVLNKNVRARVEQAVKPLELANLLEIPVGVDVSRFDLKRRDDSLLRGFGVDRQKKLITFHGQLLKSKGIDLLIVSMLFVLAAFSGDVQLLIMGVGDFENILKKIVDLISKKDLAALKKLVLVKNLKILLKFFDSIEIEDYFAYAYLFKERIIFTGYLRQDQLATILQFSDIAVIPSVNAEAFPLVAVEALACGVIPVASYHSGLREILDEIARLFGESVKIKERDVRIIAQSVIETLKRDKSRMLIGQKLREMACGKYSWDVVAREILNKALL